MIREVSGDIFDTDADIICHQVNCMGVMGAGLARQVRQRYPNVYQRYCELCNYRHCAPIKLLGKAQVVDCPDGRKIANCFGQMFYGQKKTRTDYMALFSSLVRVFEYAELHGCKKVAIPYGIGCGLAGGDWKTVYGLIQKCHDESTVDCDIVRLR